MLDKQTLFELFLAAMLIAIGIVLGLFLPTNRTPSCGHGCCECAPSGSK